MPKVIKFKTSPVEDYPDDLMTYSEFAKRHGCSCDNPLIDEDTNKLVSFYNIWSY